MLLSISDSIFCTFAHRYYFLAIVLHDRCCTICYNLVLINALPFIKRRCVEHHTSANYEPSDASADPHKALNGKRLCLPSATPTQIKHRLTYSTELSIRRKNANFNCGRGWVAVARYYDRNLFARRCAHAARGGPARTALGRETTANYE